MKFDPDAETLSYLLELDEVREMKKPLQKREDELRKLILSKLGNPTGAADLGVARIKWHYNGEKVSQDAISLMRSELSCDDFRRYVHSSHSPHIIDIQRDLILSALSLFEVQDLDTL